MEKFPASQKRNPYQ